MMKMKGINKFLFLACVIALLGGCTTLKNRSEEMLLSKEAEIVSYSEGSYKVLDYPVYVENQKMYGKLYVPDNIKEKNPTLIISHEFNGSYQNNIREAEEFVKKGFVVYIYDFRGGSSRSKSEGQTTEMSVLTEKKDLMTVMSQIKKFSFVDKDNLFIMGKSQGGFISAAVAGARPKEIKGLILVYPALCIQDDARARFDSLENVPEEVELLSMTIGRKYYNDVWDYDIYQDMPKYNGNVLIIHGNKDRIVNVSYSEKALNTYSNASLKIIDGADHGFVGKEVDEELKYVEEFLKNNI